MSQLCKHIEEVGSTWEVTHEIGPASEGSQPSISFILSTAHESFKSLSSMVVHSDVAPYEPTETRPDELPLAPADLIRCMRLFLAEFVSTFILVFAGCGSMVVDAKSGGQVTHVGMSLVWGLVVTILVYAVGHISGCHMNPAVTIALTLVRKFKWKMVPCYIGAQVGGAIVASHMLHMVVGSYANLGATFPSGSDSQSLVLEMIITFILMFVIMGVSTDSSSVRELGGVAVGATIAMNALFAGPICGASMNPARSLGPAIIIDNYKSLWIYIVGPIVGAVFGALAYEVIMLFQPPTIAEDSEVAQCLRIGSC